MNCPETLELLSSYIDGACDTPRTEAVAAHLASCPGCRAEHSQLSELVSVMHALPKVPCPPEVAARLGKAVLSSIDLRADRGRAAGTFKGVLAAAAALVVVYVGGILSRPKDEAADYRLAYLEKERSNFDAITRASPKLFGSAVAHKGAPPREPARTDDDTHALAVAGESSEHAQRPAGSDPHADDVMGETESYATRAKTGGAGLPPDAAQVVLHENAGKPQEHSKLEGDLADARRKIEESTGASGTTDPEESQLVSRSGRQDRALKGGSSARPQTVFTLQRKGLSARVKDPAAAATALKAALAEKKYSMTDLSEQKDAEKLVAESEGAAAPPASPSPPTLVVVIPESDISLVRDILKENGCVSFEVVELKSRTVRQPQEQAQLGRLAIADEKSDGFAREDEDTTQPQEAEAEPWIGAMPAGAEADAQKKELTDAPGADKGKGPAEAPSAPVQPPARMIELRITLVPVE
ncbi:MAG: zf-HC2 domain-containing protein [Planctomycetota bacterium]|nr:zf-HC2 domain-containing protein [Planctomycetota bacterium]